ncbi:MAG: hypothetical protein R2879_16135 [Saprospiraceae bacterium]
MKYAIFKMGLTFLLTLLGSGFLNAQLKVVQEEITSIPNFSKISFTIPSFPSSETLNDLHPDPIPVLFQTCDLPVFCKVEVELEKTVSFPVKFRLGSVDYVDWLEGKDRNKIIEGF